MRPRGVALSTILQHQAAPHKAPRFKRSSAAPSCLVPAFIWHPQRLEALHTYSQKKKKKSNILLPKTSCLESLPVGSLQLLHPYPDSITLAA